MFDLLIKYYVMTHFGSLGKTAVNCTLIFKRELWLIEVPEPSINISIPAQGFVFCFLTFHQPIFWPCSDPSKKNSTSLEFRSCHPVVTE